MSKINQIQAAILSLDPGAYQKLMDSYVMKKYGFSNIMPFGSHSGTNKVTKGTPDSFVQCADGRFILIAHGSVGNHAYNKVEADILSCLDTAKTGIPIEDISQIICCHTSTNFTPGQVKKLCSYFENTILIGLGEVSFDLYLKYPDLAKDHLNIDIDTHQIFSLESFLTYFSCNPYSTSLDMPLLCREQELEYINHVLNESDVILLSGPAGVGKTRLALESAKTFAESNNYDLKIIRSNGKTIYMMELNNLGEENPHLLSGFLFRVGHGECIGTKELVEYFRGDIKVLCTAYIYAHQGRSYYDFDGELFSELIRGNPEFLAGYVHKVAGKQIGRDGWHALNILWQQDDYLKLISIAMECLKNATKPFFTWDSLAEDLLSSPINMPVVNKRRNEWIKYYVEANCYDGESMRFLFGIVCNLPEEQRLPAIVTFCQCNPAFEAFRSIYIIPTHASWSGSEVPILEQHIAFLSEIKDSLIGMQFVEHRAHISEKIRNLQERKEDVLLREFLEER